MSLNDFIKFFLLLVGYRKITKDRGVGATSQRPMSERRPRVL